MAEFEAGVRGHDPAVVIDLVGDLDGRADATLAHAYVEAGSGSPTRPVVLNFTGVGYINSTGIALIVGVLAQARSEARPVRAFGLSDHYRQIFEITRLTDFLTFFPDEASAVAGQTTAPTS